MSLSTRFLREPRARLAAAGIAVLVLTLAVVGWRTHSRSAPRGLLVNGHRPDIILITIDALRADHLGVYGYARSTSPNLDALAREAVVVSDEVSQAPFTKASIASLFTALYPSTHKTYTTSRPFAETMTGHVSGLLPNTDRLASRLWRLPAALAAQGYQTIGIDTNPFLIPEFGFADGFERYQFLTDRDQLATADQVTARALAQIDSRDPHRPMFLWFHLMEPHSPYTPARQFRDMFPPLRPPIPVPGDTIPSWVSVDGSTDLNVYLATYDAEIREADTALGSFFTCLRQRGLWNNLVLVVTADHGEEFYDHGGWEHNRTLYREMLHVPLIVKGPGLPAGMRKIQMQEVDIAPTLVGIAGGAVPDGLAGEDKWRALAGTGRGDPIAYAERPGVLFALRAGDWKFISDLQVHHELYYLPDDPHELKNVALQEPERTAQMRNRLTSIVGAAVRAGAHVDGKYVPIPPRVLKRLQSLGYIQ